MQKKQDSTMKNKKPKEKTQNKILKVALPGNKKKWEKTTKICTVILNPRNAD